MRSGPVGETTPRTDAPAPSAATGELPGLVRKTVESAGRPLDVPLRQALAPRFGADFGTVRIHTDATAAASTRSLQARAYAVGQHIAFDDGEYQPGTTSGRTLIAHELAHTLQQSGRGAPDIQRQEPSSPAGDAASAPPGVSLPGGLTLFPGAERLFDLQGVRVPLPGSLRLTNALGTGGGPSYVLDIAPEQFVLSLLGHVDLSASTTPGTPPSGLNDPGQQARVSLVRPILRLNPGTGRLSASATLQVPTGYPLTLRSPNDLDVRIESSELGQFSGRIGYGPLHADMNLRLHYATDRLETALRPAFAPSGGFAGFSARLTGILRDTVPGIELAGISDTLESLVRAVMNGSLQGEAFAQRIVALLADSIPANIDRTRLSAALNNFAREVTHPGFSLSGSLGLDVPLLGTLPLSRFSAEAPTTVPYASPLLGAPSAFPLTYQAGGVILAPPGAITDIAVPALGYTYSSFGERSGTTFTMAALPTISPANLSAGGRSFNEKFPAYVFLEVSHVRRVSDTLDVGVRATAQFSTPDLTGRAAGEGVDANTAIQQGARQYQQAGDRGAPDTPPVPNFGVSIFGRFGGPF